MKALFKILFPLHQWLALVLVLPLMVLSVSGAILAIGKPVDEHLHANWFHVSANDRPLAPNELLPLVEADLINRYGNTVAYTLRMPQANTESLRVFVRAASFKGMAFYEPGSGRWLGQRGETQGWWSWLFELHAHLLMGDTGKAVAAWVAALSLISLASGFWLWLRLPGRSPRRERTQRSRTNDWRQVHRLVGVVSLPLVMLIILTGVYMAWQPIRGWVTLVAGQTPVRPPTLLAPTDERSEPPPTAQMLAAALEPWSQGRVVYITVRSRQPTRVRVRLPEDPHPNGLSSVWFDPSSGRELKRIRFDELDVGQRWVSWIYPLHSAQLWPTAQRVVWALCSLALLILMVSGLWVWWSRLARRRLSSWSWS